MSPAAAEVQALGGRTFWDIDIPGTWRHGKWSLIIDDAVQVWRTEDGVCSIVDARPFCEEWHAKRWAREQVKAFEAMEAEAVIDGRGGQAGVVCTVARAARGPKAVVGGGVKSTPALIPSRRRR